MPPGDAELRRKFGYALTGIAGDAMLAGGGGGKGEKLIVPLTAVALLLSMLPSTADLCVMLNVSASCGSEPVGIVTESGGAAPVFSRLCRPSTPSNPVSSCTSTMLSPDSASIPSSLTMDSSPFASSDPPDADLCCRIEGRLDLRPVGGGSTKG